VIEDVDLEQLPMRRVIRRTSLSARKIKIDLADMDHQGMETGAGA